MELAMDDLHQLAPAFMEEPTTSLVEPDWNLTLAQRSEWMQARDAEIVYAYPDLFLPDPRLQTVQSDDFNNNGTLSTWILPVQFVNGYNPALQNLEPERQIAGLYYDRYVDSEVWAVLNSIMVGNYQSVRAREFMHRTTPNHVFSEVDSLRNGHSFRGVTGIK